MSCKFSFSRNFTSRTRSRSVEESSCAFCPWLCSDSPMRASSSATTCRPPSSCLTRSASLARSPSSFPSASASASNASPFSVRRRLTSASRPDASAAMSSASDRRLHRSSASLGMSSTPAILPSAVSATAWPFSSSWWEGCGSGTLRATRRIRAPRFAALAPDSMVCVYATNLRSLVSNFPHRSFSSSNCRRRPARAAFSASVDPFKEVDEDELAAWRASISALSRFTSNLPSALYCTSFLNWSSSFLVNLTLSNSAMRASRCSISADARFSFPRASSLVRVSSDRSLASEALVSLRADSSAPLASDAVLLVAALARAAANSRSTLVTVASRRPSSRCSPPHSSSLRSSLDASWPISTTSWSHSSAARAWLAFASSSSSCCSDATAAERSAAISLVSMSMFASSKAVHCCAISIIASPCCLAASSRLSTSNPNAATRSSSPATTELFTSSSAVSSPTRPSSSAKYSESPPAWSAASVAAASASSSSCS
mmetsp:Transcript_17821/g.32649  ORF Transcript_17821/g.32649 Transcript_17821/m.32649 type:complete len:488 (-) Transcript_17821:739-2202(-)